MVGYAWKAFKIGFPSLLAQTTLWSFDSPLEFGLFYPKIFGKPIGHDQPHYLSVSTPDALGEDTNRPVLDAITSTTTSYSIETM